MLRKELREMLLSSIDVELYFDDLLGNYFNVVNKRKQAFPRAQMEGHFILLISELLK